MATVAGEAVTVSSASEGLILQAGRIVLSSEVEETSSLVKNTHLLSFLSISPNLW